MNVFPAGFPTRAGPLPLSLVYSPGFHRASTEKVSVIDTTNPSNPIQSNPTQSLPAKASALLIMYNYIVLYKEASFIKGLWHIIVKISKAGWFSVSKAGWYLVSKDGWYLAVVALPTTGTTTRTIRIIPGVG
jgi:hypothetical protein